MQENYAIVFLKLPVFRITAVLFFLRKEMWSVIGSNGDGSAEKRISAMSKWRRDFTQRKFYIELPN